MSRYDTRRDLTPIVGLVAVSLMMSCGGGGTTAPPPPPPPPPPAAVASVTLNPPTANLAPTQTVQLVATTKDAAGNVLTGRAVGWSSSATAFATVSTSGLVAAVADGSATITASSEGKDGTATVVVQAQAGGPVARVIVTPAAILLPIGASITLPVLLRDAN